MSQKFPSQPAAAGPARPSQGMLDALWALDDAVHAAAELKQDPWEFAVSLGGLLRAGAGETDLRRLIVGGWVEHQLETPPSSPGRRLFRRPLNLALASSSCFVLTPAGKELLTEYDRPHWDADRRILWYGGQLVKRYTTKLAVCQVAILSAFEEDGWPPRIDDPLPRATNMVPRIRLHEAIKRLNGGQRLIIFGADGTGEGITWTAQVRILENRSTPENRQSQLVPEPIFV
jgi:hypothetical protein